MSDYRDRSGICRFCGTRSDLSDGPAAPCCESSAEIDARDGKITTLEAEVRRLTGERDELSQKFGELSAVLNEDPSLEARLARLKTKFVNDRTHDLRLRDLIRTEDERDTARHRLAALEKLAGELCNCIEGSYESGRGGLDLFQAQTEMRAFLASDSAVGEKTSAGTRADDAARGNSEPRQGATETAALFTPEMVEAITSIEFAGAFAHPVSMLRPDHHWVAVDANSTHPDLTREQAIRRAFDLSRAAAKGGAK